MASKALEITQKERSLFNKTYFNLRHPAGFKGKSAITKALRGKIASNKVQKLLDQMDTYTLHSPVRLKFPRRKFLTSGSDVMWQADLIDMSSFSKQNRGYNWILCAIDVLSRKLYATPVKNKTGKAITEAFRDMLNESSSQISQLNTDRGKEFYNKQFNELMREKCGGDDPC
ncbi:MAG: DDE-type integrase/transposase/recombinase [Pseudomonadota bacterium]